MRARLLGMVWFLVALLVFGLGVPLALSVASAEQQDLFLDRLTALNRFSSLAQQPLTDDQPELLRGKLDRYAEVYGVSVLVVNPEQEPAVDSRPVPGRPAISTADPVVATALQAALAGRRGSPGSLLTPWDGDPLVLAGPVLADGEVRGAVVIVSPTDASRESIALWWLAIGAGGLLAFGLALSLAVPVVQWILRPVRRLDEATGDLVSAVVSGRDVDPVGDAHGPPELRKLGRSFDRMAASVGDALAAQRAFVADASHQLRNPLTALKLRLVNLEGHVDDAADVHRTAAVAESDRLNRILDELLAMARAENTRGDLVPVDVDAVVAERAADWRVVADARRTTLEVDTSVGPTRVLMPPRGVDAILDALLDNALKFTGPGSAVELSASVDDDRVRLTVRDHGPGLREEELVRATDRFWRGNSHQNVPGSGLGLAIVSKLVERVDGELTLVLPDGGGLAVTVEIPVAD
ncbi:putative two-component system sensor kinase [Actinokineospora spheciospongiae]|uniref:histidine kinase n=1 Tax=Actinokineospora spheciospongiae TaxID=909613 RepID=W7INF0_9PSEU|nr:HAMP domain-containing sensor histidine kinase [Actinokineospora spheciospongiae]EWC58287.1 putative two-component system sensor kinase [Actinokineospora spheciospongiae]PWW58452.1 signal transduction histidine kinase [Actinokineospora spheciospongiae]